MKYVKCLLMQLIKRLTGRIKKRGEALLDSFNAVVGRLWYRATQKHLSKKGQFVAAMLLLFVGQLVLSGIARLL